MWIIDADPRLMRMHPEVPSVNDVYSTLMDERREAGVDHGVATQLAELIHPDWGFVCTGQEQVVASSSDPLTARELVNMQSSILAYLEYAGAAPESIGAARRAWAVWQTAGSRYYQDGMRLVRLKAV